MPRPPATVSSAHSSWWQSQEPLHRLSAKRLAECWGCASGNCQPGDTLATLSSLDSQSALRIARWTGMILLWGQAWFCPNGSLWDSRWGYAENSVFHLGRCLLPSWTCAQDWTRAALGHTAEWCFSCWRPWGPFGRRFSATPRILFVFRKDSFQTVFTLSVSPCDLIKMNL